MTWWTRIFMLVLALVVIAIAGVFLGLLWTDTQLAAGRPGLISLSVQVERGETGRLVGTAIAGGAILVAVLGVAASWAGRRELIPVRSGADREPVLVPAETLAHHVADAALATEHVERARASVTPDGAGSVAIALDLRIDEDAEAGSVVSAVNRSVAAELEGRYGIRMSRKPNVEVRHVTRGPRGRAAEGEPDRASATPGAHPEGDAR